MRHDDILISIQRWVSHAKKKLNADKSENTVMRKNKIVKPVLLRLPEDVDYTKHVKLQVVMLFVNLLFNDRIILFVEIVLIISVRLFQLKMKLKHHS